MMAGNLTFHIINLVLNASLILMTMALHFFRGVCVCVMRFVCHERGWHPAYETPHPLPAPRLPGSYPGRRTSVSWPHRHPHIPTSSHPHSIPNVPLHRSFSCHTPHIFHYTLCPLQQTKFLDAPRASCHGGLYFATLASTSTLTPGPLSPHTQHTRTGTEHTHTHTHVAKQYKSPALTQSCATVVEF